MAFHVSADRSRLLDKLNVFGQLDDYVEYSHMIRNDTPTQAAPVNVLYLAAFLNGNM